MSSTSKRFPHPPGAEHFEPSELAGMWGMDGALRVSGKYNTTHIFFFISFQIFLKEHHNEEVGSMKQGYYCIIEERIREK